MSDTLAPPLLATLPGMMVLLRSKGYWGPYLELNEDGSVGWYYRTPGPAGPTELGPYEHWDKAASVALGRQVVDRSLTEKRDDTAELVEAVLRELQSRGVLVDRYEEVFGAKSFDEVVAALAKRKEGS